MAMEKITESFSLVMKIWFTGWDIFAKTEPLADHVRTWSMEGLIMERNVFCCQSVEPQPIWYYITCSAYKRLG